MDLLADSELMELITRCKSGDDDAFSALVVHYTPLIRSIIKRASFDEAECFSEACMGLYKAALSFNTEQDGVTFGLYARICISRRLFDFCRTRGVEEDRLSAVDVDSIAVSGGILSRLEAEEERRELRTQARRLLSEFEYKVFVMWLGGYKTSSIAESFSVSAKSVDNAKARITRKLRDGLPRQRS